MAGEIYIADKATLDNVKLDTTNILAKSSGTDFLSMKRVRASATKSYSLYDSYSLAETTVLEVSGKGIILDMSLTAGTDSATTIDTGTCEVRIYVDGVLAGNSYYSRSPNTLSVFNDGTMCPFSKSIKITITVSRFSHSYQSAFAKYDLKYLV